jgi:Zn-dependent protease with chaperone function
MDFFSAQDHARRISRWLIFWFALAVAGIIATVYFALVLTVGQGNGDEFGYAESGPLVLWNPELLALTTAVVGGIILIGSLYKTIQLSRGGGASVAEELGGRLVSRSSSDPLERRLINVVEEMAIASGIPVPPVYVLDAEQGINAFAAGARTNEGVVAVTRGTLEKLSRDELQGVIAHEFSHILNGDMRLNLRLIGVLHGIVLLTLAGRVMLRGARGSDRGAMPMIAAGLGLVVVGYIGVLCGKFIKAAVSRQREFLADAAAVQFTRNPAGIAGALKRIAGIGSTIEHPRAEEASHMFFGSSANFSRLLATHPPIEARIKRLDPGFDPALPVNAAASPGASPFQVETEGDGRISGFSPAAFAASVGELTPEHVAHTHALLHALPQSVSDALHQPGGARAAVFALLLATEPDVREIQLEVIEKRFGTTTRGDTEQHGEWLRKADGELRLPLLDLALPTLGELSREANDQVLATVDAMIKADGRTTLFEYVIRRLLHDALRPAGRAGGLVSLKTLKHDTATLLGVLARIGSASPEQTLAAFEAATAIAPLEGPWDPDAVNEALSIQKLDHVLAHLAATRPAFRKKLVEACATAVLHDGQLTADEAELLRAVCQALDCPVPPLTATHRKTPLTP